MTTENIKVTKPRIKAITQEDLAVFKDEINELLDERLSTFVDDFFEAWDEANGSDEPKEGCEDDKCTCGECGEPLNNPRRYMIQAGGNTWWVDNFKPNAMSTGIDVIWTEELGGKTKIVRGTVLSQDVSIFDFENDMDLACFDSIKRQTIDYAIQTAQEAQSRDKAMKAAASQETVVDSSSHVSYG